jgi:hypothetical protein
MSRSLIRKNQLHPDISDLVGEYGSGYFISDEQVVYTSGDQTISGNKNFIANQYVFSGAKVSFFANQYLFSGANVSFVDESNNRNLLVSGNRTLIGNIPDNTNGARLQIQDGITFPAIQAPRTEANTLDDYEEGTWTPTLKGDGIAGGASFSNQNGYYIKIGRNVNVHGRMTLSSTGTISGNLFIDTLPFIPVGSPNSQGTISFNFFNALATPLVNIYGHTASSPNGRINLFKLTGAATTSNARMRQTDLTNTTDLIFAGFYLALQ